MNVRRGDHMEKFIDARLEKYNVMFDLVRTESPRGKIIILSCVIEDTLAELLEARLVQNSSTEAIIDKRNSPIRDFHAKSVIAHAVGCISDDEFHDIQIIRKMRNQLAHDLNANVESNSFTDLIGNLRFMPRSEAPPQTTIVDKAVAAILRLQVGLILRTGRTAQTRIQEQELRIFM